MPDHQSLNEKQEFIDHLNEFITIIDAVREDMITKRRDADLMNAGKDRDDTLFWLDCIEDGSNSLGSTLAQYDKADIVKAIACIIFSLHFHHGRRILGDLYV